MAAYFTPEFTTFFKDLSKNNNSVWFNENKARYEKDVKIPFTALVQDIISKSQKLDPSIQIEPKEAITRLNRDIRFSKDKSLYKMHVSAIISPKGKKEKEYPGMYIELSPERIAIYGGAYQLEKEALYKVRNTIAKNLDEFKKILANKTFVNLFGELQGDKNKVLPPEFKALLDQQPLIANKNFYYMAELSPKELTSPTLLDIMMAHFKAGKPVSDFLAKAMQ